MKREMKLEALTPLIHQLRKRNEQFKKNFPETVRKNVDKLLKIHDPLIDRTYTFAPDTGHEIKDHKPL